MTRLKTFVYAVLAGLCISLGGAVFLSVDNRIAGSLLFTVGLFTICTRGLNLFTGKVCYVFQRNGSYALDLPLIWLGNLAGSWLTARSLLFTRIGPAMAERAGALCVVKLADTLPGLFLLGVFCNLLIFIAVDGFNSDLPPLGKYLALFFGVTVFILCGFEHCVADMFYFSMAGVWSGKALLYILVITLGNAVGGVIFPLLQRWKEREKDKLAL